MTSIVEFRAQNFAKLTAVAIRPDRSLVQITGRNSAGKQQPISEPVLTPKGWRPIGALKIGDDLVGADGGTISVTGLFPQTERRVFEVLMSDGGKTRCGPDHLWSVSRWASGPGKTGVRKREILTTVELIRRGVLKDGSHRRWAIDPVGPVQFADLAEEMPIDPYTLGVILGDGHIELTGYVTIASHDPEVFEMLAIRSSWKGENEIGSGEWSRPLRHLGLAGKYSFEKFIPPIYQRARVGDRKALFEGLMDTDGTSERSSWASFTTTSETLADDFVALGLSLGYVCKKRPPRTPTFTYGGIRKFGRPAWSVSVKTPEAPFRIGRKIAAWSPSAARPEILRKIESITEVAPEDSVCITVSASDGLYVTKDFIVTHNTSVLHGIWVALVGRAVAPPQPIHSGAEEARLSLDLGTMRIVRTFKKGNAGEIIHDLKVSMADSGRVAVKPQAMIDALLGDLSFNPLEFAKLSAKEQFDRVRGLVPGFDFDANAARREQAFANRTAWNRRARDSRARADGVELPPGPKPARVDMKALSDQLIAAQDHNAAIVRARETRQREDQEIEDLLDQAERKRAEAASLEDMARQRRNNFEALPELAAEIPLSDIVTKIDTAQTVIDAIAAHEARERYENEVQEAEKAAAEFAAQIDDCDRAKREAISSARMPVAALSFGDNEVLLNGLPFSQAGTAEKIRASMAIGMALNPDLRVMLVDEGSELDAAGLEAVAAMADKHGYQVWVARVAEGDAAKAGFEIVDGSLADGKLV